MPTILQEKGQSTSRKRADPLAVMADRLVMKIPALGPKEKPAVLQALHDLLDGSDEAARAVRTQIQMHLVKVADGLLSGKSRTKREAPMLTTEDAAQLMGCSRPYVAMLIDSKKLKGATVTDGGHRRVPEASVRAWIEARGDDAPSSADYKAAAKDAGMYGISEAAYIAPPKAEGKKRGG